MEPIALTGMHFFKDFEVLIASCPHSSMLIYTVSVSRHSHSPCAFVKRGRREDATRKRVLTLSLLNLVTNGSSVSFPVIRSEEHTSELQSRVDLVCLLLL